MGDTIYRYPVALRWDQGSKELKKVKNKILKYFQARSESNGGECEIRDTNCSWGYILIHFKDKEAQQRVLQKKTHRVPLLVGVISVDASLPAPGDAQSTGRVFSSLVSSDDDEASGSSSDTGHQHENNHNLHNLKRKVSKRPGDDSTEDDSTEDDSTEDDSTEDDSTEDDSTEDDSTESKEWISVDRKKHNVTSSAPKSLTEHYEHGRHQYSGTPRNESRSNSDNGASGSSAGEAFFGTVTNPSFWVYEMKIGSVTYQVKNGDITKEVAEVIVNSSNHNFTLCSGVSKAILEAAGLSVTLSAGALGSRPHKGYVITDSGNIPHCKWILHVTGPTHPTSTKKTVLDVLQECETLQASSVTFPALGTGAGGLAASTVADSILDGLVDFIKSKSVRSLQTVKVVLFQQSMLNVFYTSMKKREETTLPEDKGGLTRLSGVDPHRLPSNWKPMGETRVMEVDVAPGTPEYSAVQQKFQKTCRNQILKILRVQNRDLWLHYQIKKQNFDSKNGSTNNEKELFHGTDFNSIQRVNQNGFNRSYAGKNAAIFGKGTYFAVNANYSAINTYSKPDGNGQRHMHLARVLTGLYCVGHQEMITPPAKNTANPTDLYDSVTDDLQNPSMFVIFNDIQAYPEYHIIFK